MPTRELTPEQKVVYKFYWHFKKMRDLFSTGLIRDKINAAALLLQSSKDYIYSSGPSPTFDEVKALVLKLGEAKALCTAGRYSDEQVVAMDESALLLREYLDHINPSNTLKWTESWIRQNANMLRPGEDVLCEMRHLLHGSS